MYITHSNGIGTETDSWFVLYRISMKTCCSHIDQYIDSVQLQKPSTVEEHAHTYIPQTVYIHIHDIPTQDMRILAPYPNFSIAYSVTPLQWCPLLV